MNQLTPNSHSFSLKHPPRKKLHSASQREEIFDYDLLLILGPVFPHEVVGFSGGAKYLFPGISGGEFLHRLTV